MFTTQRSFFRPTYEDFQPQTETKDTPEFHLLLIHLPGFVRENVSAEFESLNRRVKVFGETPLGSNRWRRFSVLYLVPESCDASKLRRKFEAGIVTITLPKKVINHKDQQLARLATDHHESKAEAKMVDEGKANSDEANDQKGKEVISQKSKSTVDDGKKVEASYSAEATTGDSVTQKKGQKNSEMKMDKKVQTDENLAGSILENGEKQRVEKKETKDHIEKTSEDEKVHEAFIPGKPARTVEERKEIKGQKEKVAGSVLENSTSRGAEKKEGVEVFLGKASHELGKVNILEKAQEIIPPKSAARVEEGKEVNAQKGQEEANEKVAGLVLEVGITRGAERKESEELLRKAYDKLRKENSLEKAQDIILTKATTATEVKAPEGQGLKNENHARVVSENGKNIMEDKKETNEVYGKASQVGNPGGDLFVERERKEYTEKEKEKTNEKGKGLKEVNNYSIGKGMKEEAASGSQGMKRKNEKFSEEDKQKMIVYVATAALAVSVTIGLFNALRSS